MSMTTYPLGLPDELMEEVKRTATGTHLSMADAMRQAIKLGVPQVREGGAEGVRSRGGGGGNVE